MDYEPGPLPPVEPPPTIRVVPEGYFAALGVDIHAQIDQADGVLGTIGVVVSEPLPVDLDAEFETSIAVAEQVLADEPPESTFSPIEQVQNSGDDVDALRLDVAPHLPPVESPIVLEFDDPPEPPELRRGAPPHLPPRDPETGCPLGWTYSYDDQMCHDPDDWSVVVPRE